VLNCVLCATDFSDNAAAALDRAVSLAQAAKAKILLLHVTPLPAHARGVRLGGGAPHDFDHQTRAEVLENLKRFGQPAMDAGVETEPVLRHGDPAEEILWAAQQAGVDLIVMGRHSRAPDHWFLGSVAEHVVRKTSRPVLVAKPCPGRRDHRFHRVICALDLGETSSATMAHAAVLTRALDADLLVLHVAAGRAPDTVQDAATVLSALVTGASVPVDRVQQRVVVGTPSEGILGAAGGEGGTDLLVVLGTHGGGIIDRQFIGSTTVHLLRNSECDVLVVPAQVSAAAEPAGTASPEIAAAPGSTSLGRAR
jgi:nucleotide-binding universal stress UspA family protein